MLNISMRIMANTYKDIKSIVDDHIQEIRDSMDQVEKYFVLTDISDEERFRYVLYGIIEVYEKYRG